MGSRGIIKDHKAIIVVMNYRVGAFGWLASPELKAEGSLNAGLLDVVESFKWVRKYIRHFGGNPKLVTATGFSSGGIIVATLMNAKDGTLDLFDRAFMMSGASIPVFDRPTAEGNFQSQELYKNAGCEGPNPIACLRALPAAKLLLASTLTNENLNTPITTVYGPVMDDIYLVRQPNESLDQGLFRKIPIMLNTLVDEGTFFVEYRKVTTRTRADQFYDRIFGFLDQAEMAELKTLYPPMKSPRPFYNVSNTIGDFFFQCPARKMAKTYSSHGIPVVKSLVTHQLGISLISIFRSLGFPNLGVAHGSDIPFWWHLDFLLGPWGQERALSRVMVQAMMDFGSCPDPSNCQISGILGSVEWPKYQPKKGARINLRIPVDEMVYDRDDQHDKQCEFFERVIAAKGRNIQGQYPPTPANIFKRSLPAANQSPPKDFFQSLIDYSLLKNLVDVN